MIKYIYIYIKGIGKKLIINTDKFSILSMQHILNSEEILEIEIHWQTGSVKGFTHENQISNFRKFLSDYSATCSMTCFQMYHYVEDALEALKNPLPDDFFTCERWNTDPN